MGKMKDLFIKKQEEYIYNSLKDYYNHYILTLEYNIGETRLLIDYTYEEGEPDEIFNLNGDPGTPGYGPTIEIINVWSLLKNRLGNGVIVDVTHILDLDFEEIVLDNH